MNHKGIQVYSDDPTLLCETCGLTVAMHETPSGRMVYVAQEDNGSTGCDGSIDLR